MADHKIPTFCSKKFHALDKQGKEEMLLSLKHWKNNPLTEELLSYLDLMLNKSLLDDENKSTFTSLFESKYSSAYSKSERATLRKVINQIKD